MGLKLTEAEKLAAAAVDGALERLDLARPESSADLVAAFRCERAAVTAARFKGPAPEEAE